MKRTVIMPVLAVAASLPAAAWAQSFFGEHREEYHEGHYGRR
ncbi:hypothetical protein MSKU15_0973 [Komagataeibacter diospyri]|nr:hypothetical protein [Komagataeibacter diospyri]GCE89372.1 hypothetical protein MSKU15_0973 [Komagataeibacter diospyri]